MRVFLTGATGLIGSHLAKYLVERGDDVVALVRPTSDTGFLDSLEVDLVHGDVSDRVERLCSAMDGCSHVVHAAALVYSGRGWDAVAAVNPTDPKPPPLDKPELSVAPSSPSP